ncbi:MAG: hypothetical protein NZM31_08035 [Gemmatales bacterium]|nr:hypothetical protein [Gemmatales bacterium]MDW8386942.1 hypothetical protein [Gemmatales bacterium]
MELFVLTGHSSTQSVIVRYPGSDIPKLSLAYPQTLVAPDDPDAEHIHLVLEELKTVLNTALNHSPHVQDLDSTRREFRWALDFQLSDAAKVALSRLGGGLRIPIDATLAGIRPVRWLLNLEARTKVFPGWVVIDFGTTNSTVTLFDTWDYLPFEGLPYEQEAYLCSKIADWLRMTAQEAFPLNGKRLEAEWLAWRKAIAARLKLAPSEDIVEWLLSDPETRLHPLIEAIEVTLRLQAEPLRRAACAVLSSIYRDALRVPPLRRFHLFPIKLDPDTKSEAVPSDIEIKDVRLRRNDPNDRWPEIAMGLRAQKARLEAIERSEEVPLEKIIQRFHPSPKRYFGTEHPGIDIAFDGRVEHVTVDQLMRAGWEKLLALTNEARQQDPRFHEGPIRRAIITYPTVAPPSVRQTIIKLIRDLGISDVRIDYDEAIASAIFHILREYNTYPELGLELFKSRARIRSESHWVQNVLVFDIGGGTTDIALIRLTLTEEPVFASGSNRGAGGRYYKITPELRSSTGHMQLGGELMTLRVFYRLKALIADRLLVLTQEGKIHSDYIQSVLNTGLPEGAVTNGKYLAGWLPDIVKKENPDNNTPRLRDALNLMERVFPTRWAEGSSERSAKLQAFYALWEIAENAKKSMGGKRPGLDATGVRDPLVLTAKQLIQLFQQANLALDVRDPKALEICLSAEELEHCILKVVQEAVSIAEGALQRLPENEKLDWLILSGQSCNLRVVDQEIRKAFRNSKKFVWNPQRVTFLPEYAKLSTSIGACYAENQRRSRFAPGDSAKDLQRGINVLYFDINNLFSYLPCAFSIAQAGHHTPLFKAGDELFELYGIDNADIQRGCIRSEWMGAALNVAIYRQDYANGIQRSWGTFSAQDLANQLEFGDRQWQERIRYQFEVDHRLNIEVLLYNKDHDNKLPFYRIADDEPRVDLPLLYTKARERAKERGEGQALRNPEQESSASSSLLFDEQGTLQCDIAVGTLHQVGKTVFKLGQSLNCNFCVHDRSSASNSPASILKGMLSMDYATEFMPDGTVGVWLRPRGFQAWTYVGLLERPGEKPLFRRRYRFTLDEKGVLRIHNGEPHYQESRDPACLRNNPGWVFRAPLASTKRETDEERNPFTGKH